MCSNCRYPKEKFDGNKEIVLALNTIIELNGEYPLDHIVNVLLGDANQGITSYGHHKIKSFGIGSKHDSNFWKSILRKANLEELINYNIENLGTLYITEKGFNYIKSPYQIMVALLDSFENQEAEDDENVVSGSSGYDETLFNMLKEIRKKIAKQNNVPPYIVFQDPSLEEMAIKYPIDENELTQIVGVSATKAKRYGQPFLDLIKKHVEENEIERPDDLIIKSVANKSKLKVFIIQSVDRKMDLHDIANAKGLTMDELMEEIENIVYSGTRLDLSYYIDERLDTEYQEEIFEYFRNTEVESIDNALNELGADLYSREEIQLVKIKFISEMAN
jgi:ATP-dependent DNA helicase RecQ